MSKSSTLPDPSTPNGRIFQAAMALFLQDGKDHTAQEIATHLGWGVDRVRKHLGGQNGFLEGLRVEEEYRSRYSRSYPHMQAGHHKVSVYGPSREALRATILNTVSSVIHRHLVVS